MVWGLPTCVMERGLRWTIEFWISEQHISVSQSHEKRPGMLVRQDRVRGEEYYLLRLGNAISVLPRM
jgi:hypothetical protein